MIKRISAALAAVLFMSLTACGTLTPPQIAETTAATTLDITTMLPMTELPETVTDALDSVPEMTEDEKKRLAANTFIAEFFDSEISFEDASAAVQEVIKTSSFEHEEESTNGMQRVTLKGKNGSGIIDFMCIDVSNCSLGYDIGYICSTFGDYYFSYTKESMEGVTDDDFTTNYRLTNSVVSKSKYQQYGSLQKSDGMSNQFGYAETYAVLADNKLTVVSGQFLSTDMMERQTFSGLIGSFREKIVF